MPPQGTKFHLVLATALLAGCTGSIGGDGERAINDTVAKSLCVVDTPIRRLTRFEYNRTVRDLLGDTSNPADALPPEEEVAGFNNQAAALTSSDLLLEQYMKVAEDVSARAVGNMGALIPNCDPDLDGIDACASSFIQDFGKRAFRRPLSQSETDRFKSVFDWAIADADLGAIGELDANVVEAEIPVDAENQITNRNRFVRDLLRRAKNMCIVLGERAHTHHAV